MPAVPAVAVDLSDPSATPGTLSPPQLFLTFASGPAIILNDTVFSFDPTTPDYADYDSTGAVNGMRLCINCTVYINST